MKFSKVGGFTVGLGTLVSAFIICLALSLLLMLRKAARCSFKGYIICLLLITGLAGYFRKEGLYRLR